MNTNKSKIYILVLAIIFLWFAYPIAYDSVYHFFNYSETSGLNDSEFGAPKSFKEIGFNFFLVILSLVGLLLFLAKRKYGRLLFVSCLYFGALITLLSVGNQFKTHISKVETKLLAILLIQVIMIIVVNVEKNKSNKYRYAPLLGGSILFILWFVSYL